MVHGGKTLFRFEVVWLCIGILYLVIFAVDDNFSDKGEILNPDIPFGFLCAFSGLRLKVRGKRYEAIYGCVMLRGFRQVERIAPGIDCSQELTEKLICQMIECGYLNGLTYSSARRE